MLFWITFFFLQRDILCAECRSNFYGNFMELSIILIPSAIIYTQFHSFLNSFTKFFFEISFLMFSLANKPNFFVGEPIITGFTTNQKGEFKHYFRPNLIICSKLFFTNNYFLFTKSTGTFFAEDK